MTGIRIIIADDQTLVREGLTALLALTPDLAVVGTAADGRAALDLVPNGTNNCGTTYTTDQRNKTRPVDAGGGVKCDAGAYERQSNELIAQNCALSQGSQFDFNDLTNGVNVKVTRNSGDPGCVTVLKRSDYPDLTQGAGELPIVWAISASGATYNLDVALCYSDGELGGVSESTLHGYRWDEGSRRWTDKAGTVDAGANCVTMAGVTALSPWTLAGDGGVPTAVTLQAFTGRPGLREGNGALLLALLALSVGIKLSAGRRPASVSRSASSRIRGGGQSQ